MEYTPTPLRLLLAAIIGCWLFATAPTTFGQPLAQGFGVAPGVLIDPENGVAYLMTPTRQVEAVTLENGEVVWSTTAAARPVAVRQNRIVAQVETPGAADSTLGLVALGAADGNVMASATIDLGPGVVCSIDDGQEHQFAIGVGGYDASLGPVLWRYYQQKISGPAEPPAPPLERFGAFNVTGEAVMTPVPGGGSGRQSGAPPYSQPRILRLITENPARDQVILDLETGRRYRLDGGPVPADPDAGTTGANPWPPTGGLIITEGRPGEEFPPTRRIPGEQFARSSDRRHIVASTFGGKIEAIEPYRWTVYETGSFEVAAQFIAQTSLAPFVLTDDRILYLRQSFQRRENGKLQNNPPALIARDVESGRIVWTRPVRETRYQGSIPE